VRLWVPRLQPCGGATGVAPVDALARTPRPKTSDLTRATGGASGHAGDNPIQEVHREGDTGQQQRRDGDARGDGGLAAAAVVVVPVSDVDRAKGFYDGLGWPLDADAGGAEYHVPIRTARRRRASTELYLRETASRAGSVQLVRATSSRHAATPLKPSAKKGDETPPSPELRAKARK
jgi:hypothetical protein